MRAALMISLLCAPKVAAQSHPGVSFDQVIHSVTTRGTATITDSAFVHVTATPTSMKFEITGDLPGMTAMSHGGNMVVLVTDSGAKMTFMSPGNKQYLSINPLQMIEGAQKMMAGVGGSMKVDSTLTKVIIDSIGAGPMIDGHTTQQYRITSRFHMSIAMMGHDVEMDQQSVEEVDATPDYNDVRSISQGMDKFGEIAASFGFAKDFLDQVRKAHENLKGFPLRVVKTQTRTTRDIVQKSTETIEAKNVQRLSVPDSTFAIPADYKPASIPSAGLGKTQ
jgi:hypothetical protein